MPLAAISTMSTVIRNAKLAARKTGGNFANHGLTCDTLFVKNARLVNPAEVQKERSLAVTTDGKNDLYLHDPILRVLKARN